MNVSKRYIIYIYISNYWHPNKCDAQFIFIVLLSTISKINMSKITLNWRRLFSNFTLLREAVRHIFNSQILEISCHADLIKKSMKMCSVWSKINWKIIRRVRFVQVHYHRQFKLKDILACPWIIHHDTTSNGGYVL